MRGRSKGRYIRFFARSGTGPDCGNKNVRLENEMKHRNEKLTNAVNIRRDNRPVGREERNAEANGGRLKKPLCEPLPWDEGGLRPRPKHPEK